MAGIDSYTKLCLHCDGTDGSTSFPDASDSGHTVTANGDAQVDTAQSKFGGASGLFDGTGDNLTIPDSDDWDMGTGDFTIDLWIRFNSLNAENCFIDLGGQAAGLGFYYNNNQLSLEAMLVNSSYFTASSWTPSLATWYHLATVRNGNNLMNFVDGTQVGSTYDVTGKDITGLTLGVKIGDAISYSYPLDGWIDELRVSKGIARWTSNFTPPTRPYSKVVFKGGAIFW